MSRVLIDMLESYSERDKLLRLMSYTSQLVSGITNNKKLLVLSGSLEDCRTTLRLLDDIPMLKHSLSYGLGKKEPDFYMQVCGVVVNILDQLYYPCEHIAWAADKGFISQRSKPWWIASSIFWLFSLYFNLARSLRYLKLLHSHSKHFDLSDPGMRAEYKKNQKLQLIELISGFRSACDLAMAIHWMPEGFLWGGRLKTWQIGALGTISSIMSILQGCSFAKV